MSPPTVDAAYVTAHLPISRLLTAASIRSRLVQRVAQIRLDRRNYSPMRPQVPFRIPLGFRFVPNDYPGFDFRTGSYNPMPSSARLHDPHALGGTLRIRPPGPFYQYHLDPSFVPNAEPPNVLDDDGGDDDDDNDQT